MSPAQALDVWLTLLTDLRRPSDSDPALAAATKVLSTSPGESEDAAKARTVAGLAHFLKGDMNKAREMFAAAKVQPGLSAGCGQAVDALGGRGLAGDRRPTGHSAPAGRTAKDRRPCRGTPPRRRGEGIPVRPLRRGRAGTRRLREGRPGRPDRLVFPGRRRNGRLSAQDEARKEFEQGAEQERLSTLTTRVIGDRLAPIQGAARDALTAARP